MCVCLWVCECVSASARVIINIHGIVQAGGRVRGKDTTSVASVDRGVNAANVVEMPKRAANFEDVITGVAAIIFSVSWIAARPETS